jgi:hypothetical protein
VPGLTNKNAGHGQSPFTETQDKHIVPNRNCERRSLEQRVFLIDASIIIISIVVARTSVSDASGNTSMIGKNFSLEMCF